MDLLVWKARASWRFGSYVASEPGRPGLGDVSPTFCTQGSPSYVEVAECSSAIWPLLCRRPSEYAASQPFTGGQHTSNVVLRLNSRAVVKCGYLVISCENCAGSDCDKSIDFNSSLKSHIASYPPCQQPVIVEWKRSFSVDGQRRSRYLSSTYDSPVGRHVLGLFMVRWRACLEFKHCAAKGKDVGCFAYCRNSDALEVDSYSRRNLPTLHGRR